MPLNYFLTVSLLAFGVLDISGFSTSVRSEVREIYYPILVWHSAGETCCDHEGNLYVNFLQNEFQNKSYVKVVKIGNTKEDDFTNSLTTHPFDQVKYVCNKLQKNPIFRHGYNALGLSQGALFFRALAQTCPFPPMINLISLGGPHNGVNQYPRCNLLFGAFSCELFKFKINFKVYKPFYQSFLAPATYWHDVNNEQIYRKYSSFLSIINNEVRRNEDYVQNLQRLRRLVLVKFVNDISVVPNESTWFGFYFPNGTSYPLELTDVYREDKLGLRRMINEGKLIRLLSPLAHLELDKDWFRQNLIPILMEK